MESLFFAFDPLSTVPSLIAVIVGVIVWRRHRLDRRARIFLALALSELAFSVPAFLLALGYAPANIFASALLSGMMMTLGLLSAALFFHFGMAFPHARPWLRLGRMRGVYLSTVIVGLVPLVLIVFGNESARTNDRLIEGIVVLVGPLAIIGAIIGCLSMYRSYREMTAGERALHRVPVLGVLTGMIAGVLIDMVLGFMVAFDNRYMVLIGNVLATAAGLLFPLFYFMAAMKYRLLERHAQDYISVK